MDSEQTNDRMTTLLDQNAWLRAEVLRLTSALNGTILGEDGEETAAPQLQPHNTRRMGNLEWAVDLPLPMPWRHAKAYADILEKMHGGGWRLPTVGELVSLWNYADGSGLMPPTGDGMAGFWTAHLYDADFAWCVWLPDGGVEAQDTKADRHARCVRTISGGM